MKPPRYANARTPGRDTNDIVSNDIVSNDDIELYLSNNIELNTNNIELNTNDIVTNDRVSKDRAHNRAREELAKTLGRMQPAYRSAVKRNLEDPLGYRIEKMFRSLRKLVSNERFMQVAMEMQRLDPIEQAKLCQAFEGWCEKQRIERGFGSG